MIRVEAGTKAKSGGLRPSAFSRGKSSLNLTGDYAWHSNKLNESRRVAKHGQSIEVTLLDQATYE
jgi:hypothetical protein